MPLHGRLDAFERGDQEVVGARRLGDRDLLAGQTRDVLDRGSRRNDDRLTVAARRNCSGVEQVRVGRLCKDRRAVARIAIVDRSSSERFEQRGAKSKLDPSDPHALRFKSLLKSFLLFHDEKRADFLITDAQFLQRFSRNRRAGERRRQRTTLQSGSLVYSQLVIQVCPSIGRACSSVLPLPGHEPGFEEAHGESECEGASRNDSDADKDNVRRQELRRGHDEITDAPGRRDKLSGDERPPADAQRNADSGQDFRQRGGKHDLAQEAETALRLATRRR